MPVKLNNKSDLFKPEKDEQVDFIPSLPQSVLQCAGLEISIIISVAVQVDYRKQKKKISVSNQSASHLCTEVKGSEGRTKSEYICSQDEDSKVHCSSILLSFCKHARIQYNNIIATITHF